MIYWGKDFFGFFSTLFARMFGGGGALAPDEIQIIALSGIGIACAMIGSFLVVRKMAMVANAISHTVLLGIVSAFVIFHLMFAKPFTEMLEVDMKLLILAALFASLLTMLFVDFFSHILKLARDASIGLVFTSLFSVGIILVTLFTKNSHIGAEVIMGNVDMLHKNDIWIALFLCCGNLLCLVLFFKEYMITSFDPEFAKLSRISPVITNYLVIFQTSLTLVGSFRAVGVVLVLALLIVPSVTARMFVRKMKALILVSSGISLVASVLAVALSRHILTSFGIALSTSGLMVAILFGIWLLALSKNLVIFVSHKIRFLA